MALFLLLLLHILFLSVPFFPGLIIQFLFISYCH